MGAIRGESSMRMAATDDYWPRQLTTLHVYRLPRTITLMAKWGA